MRRSAPTCNMRRIIVFHIQLRRHWPACGCVPRHARRCVSCDLREQCSPNRRAWVNAHRSETQPRHAVASARSRHVIGCFRSAADGSEAAAVSHVVCCMLHAARCMRCRLLQVGSRPERVCVDVRREHPRAGQPICPIPLHVGLRAHARAQRYHAAQPPILFEAYVPMHHCVRHGAWSGDQHASHCHAVGCRVCRVRVNHATCISAT